MYPFWNLYQKLKSEMDTSLSIDDYFLFLKSFNQMPEASIKDFDQFISFCKIFWLKNSKHDYAFETLFKVYKKQMLKELEKIIAAKLIERTEKLNVNEETKLAAQTGSENDKSIESLPDSQTLAEREQADRDRQLLQNPAKDKADISDIQLLIQDSNNKGNEDITNFTFNHFFFMGDDFIMPFDKRYVAQRLRRLVETKEKVAGDRINIPEILRDFSRDQYISEVHMLQEDFSNSKVVLLSDRMGSMLAYEHIEKHLSETFGIIPGAQLEYYFFANLPPGSKDNQHYLLSSALEMNKNINSRDHKWDRNTWFFILSDAGAHSGTVSGGRIKATIKFWNYLRNISFNVFWLNPVPNEFMNDCTAKRLQMMIPMYGLEEKELKKLFRTA